MIFSSNTEIGKVLAGQEELDKLKNIQQEKAELEASIIDSYIENTTDLEKIETDLIKVLDGEDYSFLNWIEKDGFDDEEIQDQLFKHLEVLSYIFEQAAIRHGLSIEGIKDIILNKSLSIFNDFKQGKFKEVAREEKENQSSKISLLQAANPNYSVYPTGKGYEFSLTTNYPTNSKATLGFLPEIKENEHVEYKDGELSINGNPIKLHNLQTGKDIEINNFPPKLQVFLASMFSITYFLLKSQKKNNEFPTTLEMNIKDYYKLMREKTANFNAEQDIESFKNNMGAFSGFMGIVDPGKNHILTQVLNLIEIDKRTGRVLFQSGYIERMIERMEEENVKKDKHGKTLLKSDGTPQLKPYISKLLKNEFWSQSGDYSKQIILSILPIFEQSGERNKTITISLKTIFDNNLALENAFNRESSKKRFLKRVFSNAWDYLNNYTHLGNKFELPQRDSETHEYSRQWIPETKDKKQNSFTFIFKRK